MKIWGDDLQREGQPMPDIEILKKEMEKQNQINDLKWSQHDASAHEFREFVKLAISEIKSDVKLVRLDFISWQEDMEKKYTDMLWLLWKISLGAGTAYGIIFWIIDKFGTSAIK